MSLSVRKKSLYISILWQGRRHDIFSVLNTTDLSRWECSAHFPRYHRRLAYIHDSAVFSCGAWRRILLSFDREGKPEGLMIVAWLVSGCRRLWLCIGADLRDVKAPQMVAYRLYMLSLWCIEKSNISFGSLVVTRTTARAEYVFYPVDVACRLRIVASLLMRRVYYCAVVSILHKGSDNRGESCFRSKAVTAKVEVGCCRGLSTASVGLRRNHASCGSSWNCS
ncbi:hypothetical protein BV25DRAFT_1705181 [Artomyces pyxidatus]|uniref:Uncharacterized protein n=1 Tax=Artomyces pyxidatus TaxID=48021 RepID=A0ACB8TB51_9AGAM|nr:hypothetical protein BV25DRAFT_1705181 [Artomyces pyxidatus]